MSAITFSHYYCVCIAFCGSARGRANQPKRPEMASKAPPIPKRIRSEEHTSELQSLRHLVCRLLLEKNKHRGQLGDDLARQDLLLLGAFDIDDWRLPRDRNRLGAFSAAHLGVHPRREVRFDDDVLAP